jgi:hypothetical protein
MGRRKEEGAAVVEQVLIAMGLMAFVFFVTVVVGTTVVVRRVRRRWRASRTRFVVRRASQPDLGQLLRTSGSAAAASVGSPGWWMVQNRRHRMWRAVTSAEHAVGVARRAEVAVGDLPELASRLRAAATGVDAVLRASGRQGSLSTEDRADCDRIVRAATDVRAVALTSLRTGSHLDTDAVVSAVEIEVAALAAGVRAAHR